MTFHKLSTRLLRPAADRNEGAEEAPAEVPPVATMTHSVADRVNAIEAWTSELEHSLRMLRSHVLGLKCDLNIADEQKHDPPAE